MQAAIARRAKITAAKTASDNEAAQSPEGAKQKAKPRAKTSRTTARKTTATDGAEELENAPAEDVEACVQQHPAPALPEAALPCCLATDACREHCSGMLAHSGALVVCE